MVDSKQPSSVAVCEFSPLTRIWYPSTSLRACAKVGTTFKYLCHVFLLRLSLAVELVTVTHHPPFEPVFRDVLPVPLVQLSLPIQHQVDPRIGQLVFRVEDQVGEPHIFKELKSEEQLMNYEEITSSE